MIVTRTTTKDSRRKTDAWGSSYDELFKHKVSSMVTIIRRSCDNHSISYEELSILSKKLFIAREKNCPSFSDEQFVARAMKYPYFQRIINTIDAPLRRKINDLS